MNRQSDILKGTILDAASHHGGEKLVVAGGLLGALAASSCCVLPLVLFSIGVSGAWIGNLTALAPYQPYFITATLACLGYGYWLVYRGRKLACAEGAACARPLPNHIVKAALVMASASRWRRDWLGLARTLFL